MASKSYNIPKTLIWEAWLRVKANQRALGIDAETIGRAFVHWSMGFLSQDG